jgi:glycerate kinase
VPFRDDSERQIWQAVGARPVEQKKGADKGIDGRLYFHDGTEETRQAIFSVKAGRVTSSHVRDLVGVLSREKAALGVLISFEKPTREMAEGSGFRWILRVPLGKTCQNTTSYGRGTARREDS